MALISDVQIAFRLALRARFWSVSGWLLIALGATVLMAAQFSGRQPATVALDVGISFIRLSLPLAIVLLAQELFSREFDRRLFLTSLTYPRPRFQFFIGRFVGAYALVFALLAAMGTLLALLVGYIGADYEQATPVSLGFPYLTTVGFIAVDLFVVAAVAALISIAATTPSFIMVGTFGFLLMARSWSGIIALLEQDATLVANPELYRDSLRLLGYLLPNLGALDVRAIALYDAPALLPTDWSFVLAHSAIYGGIFLGLSVWLLQRKQFS